MKITTKEQFSALSQRGLLGNFLRTWATLDDVRASGHAGWLTIQSLDKASPHFLPWVMTERQAPGATFEDLTNYPDVHAGIQQLVEAGARRDQMYFREVPGPGARRVIQFEAMRGPGWLGSGVGGPIDLHYELDTMLPLRGIRERGTNVTGLLAQTVLQHFMDPASWETLQDIWDRCPTAIIEATEFSQPGGVFRQRLVVWEVRDF